ncbi:MAG: ImmA/IrrE family metallo-endopeptidase [Oscillospiraceae bacterium]|jgi:Zn-dependent peptidase ImmA (M78 family)|nr:ImmA/IrrE family metallo-endopeptidase [Oscillospiraceae bacterium]
MWTIDGICAKARALMKLAREPMLLARDMGILVRYESMGTSERACKGFYVYAFRRHVITINGDLSEDAARIVLAHELGHAALHRDAAQLRAFHDFSLYDTSKLEYEANVFAAELLLDDDEVIERLNEDTFFFLAARELRVPPELLDIKFRTLKHRGYQIDLPLMAKSNFLKNALE